MYTYDAIRSIKVKRIACMMSCAVCSGLLASQLNRKNYTFDRTLSNS